MLAPLAPWLNVDPLTMVNAASTGARLGLERSQIQTGAQEAADRLRFGYAQLASENARSGAALGAEMARAHAADALRREGMQTALQKWAAEMGMKQQQLDAMDKYHQDEVAARNRQISLLDQFHKGELTNRKNQLAIQLHKMLTGDRPLPDASKVTIGGEDFLKVPHKGGAFSYQPFRTTATGKLTDAQHIQIRRLEMEEKELQKKYTDNPTLELRAKKGDPDAKAAYDADQARLGQIRGIINGMIFPKDMATPAADALLNQTPINAEPNPVSMSDDRSMEADTGRSTAAAPLKITAIRPAAAGDGSASFMGIPLPSSPIPGIDQAQFMPP